MQSHRDGVSDGWILFEAWCKRNGGTPIRGSSPGDHICFVGPLPDDTIEPGDTGTVNAGPTERTDLGRLEELRLDLALKAADVELEEAKLRHEKVKRLVEAARKSKSV